MSLDRALEDLAATAHKIADDLLASRRERDQLRSKVEVLEMQLGTEKGVVDRLREELGRLREAESKRAVIGGAK